MVQDGSFLRTLQKLEKERYSLLIELNEVELTRRKMDHVSYLLLSNKLKHEISELDNKREMYKFYDLYDLLNEIEFRKLSDHLI